MSCSFFFSSRRRHTRCALVTGVQTCALPIYGVCGAKVGAQRSPLPYSDFDALRLVSRRSPLARGIADRTRPSAIQECRCFDVPRTRSWGLRRSEEHTSELQSLMRISYAVFCLKTNKNTKRQIN